MTFNGYPQSGTMTQALGDSQPRTSPQLRTWKHGYAGNQKLTAWPLRLVSGAIDYLPLILIWDLFGDAHVAILGFLVAVAVLFANNVYMQGTTGQSLGKRVVGIRLVSLVNSGPTSFTFVYPGVGRCFGRQLAHFLDLLVLYTGFFRPIWQTYHQTWADTVSKTVVIPARCESLVEHRPGGAESTL